MNALRRELRWLKLSLIVLLLATSVAVPTVQAGRIATETLATQAAGEQARDRVLALLERREVRAELQRMGVDPAAAEQRVAALSDTEARQLATRMDELPAGGNSLIGAAVFIFLVLLITDILGFTDVFPFVKKTVQ